jgi:natural product precursor
VERLSKLVLFELEKKELTQHEMKKVRGGNLCCCYVGSGGGSSNADNVDANINGGLFSYNC